MDDKYVLAMYDVRGKQEFIFRTNKLQEIVGGSWIIRDVFDDYLFPVAKSLNGKDCKGIYSYKREENGESEGGFDPKKGFIDHLEAGYIGEVIYDGGGNFILVFKNKQIFQDVTYAFTKTIMEEIGTLRVLGSCVEIDNFDDYREDDRRLRAKHRENEAQESIIAPWACLPIVQVDRKTSQPLVDYADRLKGKPYEVSEAIKKKGVDGKLSKESFAKLLKYHEELYRINNKQTDKLTEIEREFYRKNEKILDEIVEKKGVDSQLAVIYIDGNNMGAQVQRATKDARNYADCSEALRRFSTEIQKIYVEEGVDAALKDVDKSFRIVVSAGDEINFIVKAKDAFKCAYSYLENLRVNHNEASACAGISVFHSHAPYADAYKIAEEACETGKKMMKKEEMNCTAFIDYHIGQGATGISLEKIREKDNAEGVSRPWLIWNKDDTKYDDVTEFDTIEEILVMFRALGRGNVKGLAAAAKEGKTTYELELKRIYAHQSNDFKKKYDKKWNEWLIKLNNKDRIIYDIVIAYDLWFDEWKSVVQYDEQEA